jgi:cytochrome c peroxidase
MNRTHTALAAAAFAATICNSSVFAQRGGGIPGPGGPIGSLKPVSLPAITGEERYVRDYSALILLGKALFWDVQAGSDGRTACATCHFHAGADHRVQNQLASPPNATVSFTPNRILSLADFPFRLLNNPNANNSGSVRNNRYVAGSAGVAHRAFFDVVADSHEDSGADVAGGPFSLDGLNTRQVTGRNTPSVINAVFNVLNFWDGRASNTFSGTTPFGEADLALNVLSAQGGQLVKQQLRLPNSSLASQAVGPALNSVEMSYVNRTWAKLGRKLVNLPPLARQRVAGDDSVLGAVANPDGKGLFGGLRYAHLIETAFHPEWWSSQALVDGNGSLTGQSGAPSGLNYSQMEANFPIFWGLAIQAYERTLIANDSRVDRFLEGDQTALSPQERQGLAEFQGGASQCTQCHMGPELSAASFTNVQRRTPGGLANARTPNDFGFFRIGVSPVAEDVGGAGQTDFGTLLFPNANPGQARGVFKTPALRNVELTGPYFHNGSQATLDQVLQFYARNGEFPQDGNLGPGIGQIRLGQGDRNNIVAFLKALTDDRVKFERAPFDHPELCIPTGHVQGASGTLAVDLSDTRFATTAADRWALIPMVGRQGNGVPLQTFEELLQGIGSDGSRAHNLTQSCQP